MGRIWSACRLPAVVICLSLIAACESSALAGPARRGLFRIGRTVGHRCADGSGCRIPLRDRSRYLNITAEGAAPMLPYVLGVTFRLKADARPYRLVGYDSRHECDSLLRSPSGRYVIYGTSHRGWPALELLDLVTGTRSVFQGHACDPAWGHDDQLAYVHYVTFNSALGDYTGRVVVQHGLSANNAAVWTGTGAWTNLVWAGDDLLLNHDDGLSPGRLAILYGPGRERSVDGHPDQLTGPFSTVVAVNPAGTEALLDTERLGPGGGASGAEDRATLLRISDDAVLSTALMNSDEAHPSDLAALASDGSWRGSSIVTADGVFLGGSSHPPAALATLTVTDDRVQLRSVKQLIEYGNLPPAQDLDQASQARFLDASGRRVAVWFDGAGQLEYVVCQIETGRCISGHNYSNARRPTVARFVSNQSRP